MSLAILTNEFRASWDKLVIAGDGKTRIHLPTDMEISWKNDLADRSIERDVIVAGTLVSLFCNSVNGSKSEWRGTFFVSNGEWQYSVMRDWSLGIYIASNASRARKHTGARRTNGVPSLAGQRLG